ncbi:MAG: hypothetical protein J6L86_01610 [Alphaproteobacteria bacterium]|nr:hypothetical protein [Alphaproteobacteria bacterium]MBQ8630587.1 hypothetical protein [Alphaproteobacteria bacterium]
MRTRKEIHQEIIDRGGLVKLDQLSTEELKKLYSLYCEDLVWIQANAPLHQYNAMFNANFNARKVVNQAIEKKSGKKHDPSF